VKTAHLHFGLLISLGLHSLLVLLYLNNSFEPPSQPEGSPLELSLDMFQAMSAAPSFAQPATAEPAALPKESQPEPQQSQATQTVANTPAPKTPEKPVTEPQTQQVEAKQPESEPRETRQTKTEQTEASPQSTQISAAENSAREQASAGTRNNRESEVELQRYNMELLAEIERAKYYPNRARRRHHEGTTTVAFIIDLKGVISNIRIEESSGYSTLDNAAVNAIQRVGQFRPLPESLGLHSMEFRVPLSFELGR
jgi:protein TonB